MIDCLAWWAWGLASLGWLYAVLARFWHRLFNAEVIRHSRREGDGYRFGRALYWQLSARAAALLAGLAPAPVAAGAYLPAPWAAVALAAATLALVTVWLIRPPGQRLGLLEHRPTGREPWFELRGAQSLGRALVVLSAAGLLPAAALGAGLAAAAAWLRGLGR